MKASGHTSGSAVIGVIATFSLLTYIATTLRLWTRFKIHRQPGVDDAMITISCIFNFVMGLSMIFQVSYGLGQHVETIDPQDLRKMMMWFWLSIWTYYSAQGFAKLAILFQYLRIFGNIKKFRIACWCVILACGFYTLWGTVTAILICIPVAGFWELEWQSNGRARCMPIWRVKIPIWFFNAAMNMTTDLAIAILPIPVIKTLNLPKKQRIMLGGVFCLGGLVCIISIVRLSGLYAIAVSHDPTYDNPLAALWSATEASFTALASNLPVLKGFFAQHFPRMFHSAGSAATDDRYGADLSGPSHSKLKDPMESDGGGSASRQGPRWGKKMTTVCIEEARSDGSPGSGGREDWGWDEHRGRGHTGEQRGGGIEMQTIIGESSLDEKGNVVGGRRKGSNESVEALVPV